MKILATSGGVTNTSIREALVDLLRAPIEQSQALVIPTAQWGHPLCSPQTVWNAVSGRAPGRDSLVDLGWRSVGVLELTAMESIGSDRWLPWVQEADALLVDGGEVAYLVHWLRRSGLADLLSELVDTVWVGVSAGSMALTPRFGREFLAWHADADDSGLGLVDFSIFPHLDYPGWAENTLARAHEWSEGMPGVAYAIDDDTAISVNGDEVRIVSEGRWELLRTR